MVYSLFKNKANEEWNIWEKKLVCIALISVFTWLTCTCVVVWIAELIAFAHFSKLVSRLMIHISVFIGHSHRKNNFNHWKQLNNVIFYGRKALYMRVFFSVKMKENYRITVDNFESYSKCMFHIISNKLNRNNLE
jgi:hypothetical protein